jgi:hypothetical protein
MAASQLVILSLALTSSNAAIRNRLRRRAISWFTVYIGLSSWVAWGYATEPGNPPSLLWWR